MPRASNITAVTGANWGDEGKGRMVDALAAEHEFVVRFQGGGNAGHTIITEQGKFVLHLLPSGVLRPGKVNVLAPGVALDPALLGRELAELSARGIPEPELWVSNRAQLLFAHHRLLDQLEEERLGARRFGSTRAGIAPFYADKCAKLGVTVDELFDESCWRERLSHSLAGKNVLLTGLYGQPPIELDSVLQELRFARGLLEPFVRDTASLLGEAARDGRGILLEGQLGALRDPDHGIYPWVTSSSTLAGFASVGAGLPAAAIGRVVAVTKAYSSAVGAGPLVSELFDSAADELRRRGGNAGEYGATTGRPRRVGWFDAVATRYGCRAQGATELALTNLDVLGYLERIAVCTAYRVEGRTSSLFPTSRQLGQAEPVYEWLEGWRCPIGAVRSFEDLPTQAQAYVLRLESLLQLPIRWVSYGPRREQLLDRGCPT
jgi:adenylosuccinate synthase